MMGLKLVMIDPVNDRQVDLLGGGRDQYLGGAGVQVFGGRFPVVEKPGAFHRHVDSKLLPRQRGRVAFGGHLHGPGAGVQDVAVDDDFGLQGAVDGIVFQQVGVHLRRSEVVDGHHFHVVALGFHDPAQDQPPDPAKSVDANTYRHTVLRQLVPRRVLIRRTFQ